MTFCARGGILSFSPTQIFVRRTRPLAQVGGTVSKNLNLTHRPREGEICIRAVEYVKMADPVEFTPFPSKNIT